MTVFVRGYLIYIKVLRSFDSYSADANGFRFHMCTGKTEYTFSISPENEDIYCGASYNVVFYLGMFGGGQFFRIRNYKDNSENFCGFFCDFNYESQNISVPTDRCKLGECITTDKGVMWCVKRYTDDEIAAVTMNIYTEEMPIEARFLLIRKLSSAF